MTNYPHLRDVALRCNHSDSDESSTTAQQRRAFGRAANSDAHTLWLCFANASSIYRPFPGARRKVPAPFQEPSRSATQAAAARHTTGTGANVHGGQHHVHLPCKDGRSQRGHHKCAMSRCGRKMCEEQVQWKDKGRGCLAPNRENRNSVTSRGTSGTRSGIQKHDTRKGGRQTGCRIRCRRVAMSELEDIHNAERLPDGMLGDDRRGLFGMEENARRSSEKSMRKMERATRHAVSGSAI